MQIQSRAPEDRQLGRIYGSHLVSVQNGRHTMTDEENFISVIFEVLLLSAGVGVRTSRAYHWGHCSDDVSTS